MTRLWWRRNGLWLLALPILLALTVLASSQRLINFYLPWEPHLPVTAQDNKAEFQQDAKQPDGVTYHRAVNARLLSVRPVNEFNSLVAPEGAQLWQADLEFQATPDQQLARCTVELIADGVRYSNKTAKEAGTGTPGAYISEDCVPQDTPGPAFDAITKTVQETTPPRPEKWQSSFSFAVPAGIEPDGLRLWWDTPEYLLFPLGS
ncbi:MAG: hypothetical protein Q4D79_11270 [Propionibacteriaceae bacterium]|nr:hypothetical protein [Propionibacteriaceae bacterium]